MTNLNITEVTMNNKEEYLDQIADLEVVVLNNLIRQGKEGQLFITGKEDIEGYVDSKDNSVFVATNDKNEVVAATYITQNQSPFTYNDITKYFKYGDEYNEYVKSLYKSDDEYKMDMLRAYDLKLNAYKEASRRVLEENSDYGSINEFMKHELNEKENKFHEKSKLREDMNKYMSQYVRKNAPEQEKLYEKFFWTTADDISKEFGKEVSVNNLTADYERFIQDEKSQEYSDVLKNGNLKIYEKPKFDIKPYYDANTKNSVEIDTYITSPENRQAGMARILVFEGIKKHIQRHFGDKDNSEIFLCSTLHRNNVSSKYVSEFFGLKDSLFVKRRYGRDREVHICKVDREKSQEYIEKMENKLAVLYGYNPKNKQISYNEQIDVLAEQLKYEKEELNRLKKVKKDKGKKFVGARGVLKGKRNKIEQLKSMIKQVKTKEYEKGGMEL